MAEEIIYTDSAVSVSTSRIVILGTTYALRNITSVKMTTGGPNADLAIPVTFFSAFGLIMFLGWWPRGMNMNMPIAARCVGGLVSGLALCVGLLWLRASCKAVYFVTIASSSGEEHAFASKDRSYVEKIVGAISDALAQI